MTYTAFTSTARQLLITCCALGRMNLARHFQCQYSWLRRRRSSTAMRSSMTTMETLCWTSTLRWRAPSTRHTYRRRVNSPKCRSTTWARQWELHSSLTCTKRCTSTTSSVRWTKARKCLKVARTFRGSRFSSVVVLKVSSTTLRAKTTLSIKLSTVS